MLLVKSGPPVPAGGRDRGAIRAMPTTLLLSPSPQGHGQRRVSSPPQAKFGRGPPHQKILTVVLAQHPSPMLAQRRGGLALAGRRGDSRVPCRYTRKRRARPRARKVQRLRDVKPLANGAGLSRVPGAARRPQPRRADQQADRSPSAMARAGNVRLACQKKRAAGVVSSGGSS